MVFVKGMECSGIKYSNDIISYDLQDNFFILL
jgi:hypothetical protein